MCALLTTNNGLGNLPKFKPSFRISWDFPTEPSLVFTQWLPDTKCQVSKGADRKASVSHITTCSEQCVQKSISECIIQVYYNW